MRKNIFAVLIPALIFLAFGGSLWQGFASLDDHFLIVNNLAVRGITLENLKTIFTTYDPELYIPLTFLTFQINYVLGGLDPFGFHLLNLLLHSLNAMLVSVLMFKLLSKQFSIFNYQLSILVGLLFAVHPLNTEAVVWVAGRKDLLSTLFFLGSLIAYIRYYECTKSQITNNSPAFVPQSGTTAGKQFSILNSLPSEVCHKQTKWGQFLLSIALFLAALLSKVNAATLPAVLILYDVFIEQRRIDKRFILEKIPYVVLSIVFLVIAAGGKERILASSSLWETFLMANKSTVFYLAKLFVPINLSVFYPFTGTITLSDPTFFGPLLLLDVFLVFFIASKIFNYQFSRLRQGFVGQAIFNSFWRIVLFGFLFYVLTLAPTFFNFHKGDTMFFAVDRYAYLPSLGILITVGILAERLRVACYKLQELQPATCNKILSVIAMAIIGLFTTLSFFQTKVWDSSETLNTHALKLYPNSIHARTELARIYRSRNQYQQAFDILKEGLKYSDHVQLRLGAGTIFAATGQISEAREQFEEAASMDATNPDPLFYLGSLEEQLGNVDLARKHYEEAIALDPSYVIARVKLGKILIGEGNLEGGRGQLEEALRWNPNSVEAHLAMAELLKGQGNNAEAQVHSEKAAALQEI